MTIQERVFAVGTTTLPEEIAAPKKILPICAMATGCCALVDSFTGVACTNDLVVMGQQNGGSNTYACPHPEGCSGVARVVPDGVSTRVDIYQNGPACDPTTTIAVAPAGLSALDLEIIGEPANWMGGATLA